ncbi:hypothetical protein CEXT_603091 [Caerostris extrusa]|uniref:Uncharacterized protein n=1 Tax=Caerostris extrusa TaxID=172846 RepID=A0AAV4NJ11_CAEEX|nr:hypothetical protein CEXT_603091 [Caerostris extrusa]
MDLREGLEAKVANLQSHRFSRPLQASSYLKHLRIAGQEMKNKIKQACMDTKSSLGKIFRQTVQLKRGLLETARSISITDYSRPMIACFKVNASDNSSPCLIRCLMRSESNGISEMGRGSQFFLAELPKRNPRLDASVV